jgi:hypothetical protein
MLIQVTDVNSNQDWAATPDMIEVSLTASFLQLAEKCVTFLKKHDVNYMCSWWAFGYTLYKAADGSEAEESSNIIGNNGLEYIEFESEFQLEGCNAKIYSDGDIKAVLPAKHGDDEIWVTIGNIKDLKFRFESESESILKLTAPEGTADSSGEFFPGATKEEVASVMMQDIVGDYDIPATVPEWQWVQSVASFVHCRNGQGGVWEFVINLSLAFENVPEKLEPVLRQARDANLSYLILHQGT